MRFVTIIFSLVFGLFAPGIDGEECSKSPLPYMVGKSLVAHPGCGPDQKWSRTTLRVERYGLFFSVMYPWPKMGSTVCAHEMVLIYTKKDKVAYILNRPSVKADYFSKTHPMLYKRYLEKE